MESDAAYNEAVECINCLFTSIFAMERKYEQHSFEWSEIEQEYQKSFNNALAVESISLRLALVFGGESRQSAARFVKCQLRGILQCISENDTEQKSVRNNPIVQYLATPLVTEKKAATSPRGRIALAYEAFKKYHGYILEQWRERRAPPIQNPPPVLDAPPTVSTRVVIKQEIIDLTDSPPGSPRNIVTSNVETMDGDTRYMQSFFTSLLNLEERFGQKKFNWEDIVEEHQKLFNETLTLDMLAHIFNYRLDDSTPITIRCIVFDALGSILYTRNNDEMNPKIQFHSIFHEEEIPIRAPDEPYSRAFVASRYAAFKASRGFGAQQSEAIPLPLVLQVLFTTFLALERKFGMAEFTWNDMVEMHQKLCGETLTSHLLEQVFGGLEHDNTTIRSIFSRPLNNVFELTDIARRWEGTCKVNPRMRFRSHRKFSEETLKQIKWTPGKPMSVHFVEAQYAAFKTSQGFVAGQSEGEAQAPPLQQTPSSVPVNAVIKQKNIDLSKYPSFPDAQPFFTALLGMDRKYGQEPFKWKELEQEYQKLFNEKLMLDLIAIAFSGHKIRFKYLVKATLRSVLNVVGGWKEAYDLHNNPLVHVLKTLPLGKYGKKALHERIGSAYAAFKASQAFIPGQSKVEHAPPLLPAPFIVPASVVIKQEIIDSTVDKVTLRKKKRQVEAGEENVDEDEPKIKRRKTGGAEVAKVKEEPKDPMDELEKKDNKKKKMKNVKVEQVDE